MLDNFTDFMLDLETLDLAPTAAIIQIACVPFDFMSYVQGLAFNVYIDKLTSIANSGTVSKSTLKFWSEQSSNLRNKVLGGTTSIVSALGDLQEFVEYHRTKGTSIRCWSHNTFDPPILMHAYAKANMVCPFKHYEFMDIRTLTYLAGSPNITITNNYGPKHDARADCLYQIDYCKVLHDIIRAME